MRYIVPLCFLIGCGSGGAKSAATDYSPMIDGLTEQVILPAFTSLTTTADSLQSTLVALEAAPTTDTVTHAQAAWRAARAAYRTLDGVHFGPIESLGIAERVDVAPASTGDIDTAVQGAGTLDANAIAAAGGAAKGYLAIEYILFDAQGRDSVLTALSGDGTPARRRTYARLVGDEIAASMHTLADAWTSAGGEAELLESAGSGNPRYTSQRAAIDELVGGVAYGLELVVGTRLALPLGRKSTGTPTPSADPTAASDSAVADMTSALTFVRALYQEPGFTTRIRPKSSVLDDRCSDQLSACIEAVAAIPAPFVDSVVNNNALVQDAYTACKVYKATWNTDATSALGATLRPTDNDGD